MKVRIMIEKEEIASVMNIADVVAGADSIDFSTCTILVRDDEGTPHCEALTYGTSNRLRKLWEERLSLSRLVSGSEEYWNDDHGEWSGCDAVIDETPPGVAETIALRGYDVICLEGDFTLFS